MQHVAIDLGSQESQVCIRTADGTIVEEKKHPTRSLGDWMKQWPTSRVILETSSEAFRVADAGKALSYAGAAFQTRFKDPMAFMTAIAGSGYAPIFTSISDSFGKYEQPDDKTVLQEVDFVGGDQKLFVAIYALSLEPGGWRVEGVQLAQTSGMGI